MQITTSLDEHAVSSMPSALAALMKGGLNAAKLHPVGRMGEVRDVVDAVLSLESAAFTSGEILHVDRGQSAGH